MAKLGRKHSQAAPRVHASAEMAHLGQDGPDAAIRREGRFVIIPAWSADKGN